MKTEMIGGLVEKFPKIKSIWSLPSSNTTIMLLDDTEDFDSVTFNAIKSGIEGELRGGTSIVFYRLSDYWELVRHGSPVTFTEIAEGVPLFDPSGFFLPLKKLISEGRIPGTKEAMRSLIDASPYRLLRIERMHLFRVAEEMFSAVVDAGQAPLILAGVAPPVPRELADKLKTHFVKKGRLEPEYARYCEEVVKAWKDLEHGRVKTLEYGKVDELVDVASRFVTRMEKLVEELSK